MAAADAARRGRDSAGAALRERLPRNEAGGAPGQRFATVPWRIAWGFGGGLTVGAVIVALLSGGETAPPDDLAGALEPPGETAPQRPAGPATERTTEAAGPSREPVVEPSAAEEAGPSAADLARGARTTLTADAPATPAAAVAGAPEPASVAEAPATSVAPRQRPPGSSVAEAPAEQSAEDTGPEAGGLAAAVEVLDEREPAPEAAPETADAGAAAPADGQIRQGNVAGAAAGDGSIATAATQAIEAAVAEAASPGAEDAEQPEAAAGGVEAETAAVAGTAAVAETAGAQPDTPAEPEGAGILYVRATESFPDAAFDETVEKLGALGYRIEESRRVGFRISQTNVRYFHAADAELAGAVAGAVAGTSRDFTTYRPSPQPGTIEVWLGG